MESIHVAEGESSSVLQGGDGEVESVDNVTDLPRVMVKYDLFYRTEADYFRDTPAEIDEEEFVITWPKKRRLLAESAAVGTQELDDEDSDIEPDIKTYIEDFERRKDEYENINGESYRYDESLDCFRNIHYSSLSLTEYVMPNYEDFGQSHTMRQIMTPEEKAMLGVPESPLSLSDLSLADETSSDTSAPP